MVSRETLEHLALNTKLGYWIGMLPSPTAFVSKQNEGSIQTEDRYIHRLRIPVVNYFVIAYHGISLVVIAAYDIAVMPNVIERIIFSVIFGISAISLVLQLLLLRKGTEIQRLMQMFLTLNDLQG
jgi:hypothetical protein